MKPESLHNSSSLSPIIYKFPKRINKPINLLETDFIVDAEPSPKLLKYGFNQTMENLDIISITDNPYYKSGLNFDFDRKDSLSIREKCKDTFGSIDDYKKFCTYWEVLIMFGFLDSNLTILTSEQTILKEIGSIHKKLFKSKATIGFPKTKVDLVFQTYSTVNLEENALIHLLMQDLPNLLAKQSKGSTMILQIFGLYTQIMVELIYYLSTLYDNAYLMKPEIVSNLSDEKYLILDGLIGEPKIKYPKSKMYLSSISIGEIPQPIINMIQCMNSTLVSNKLSAYHYIKSYLASNVFEGIRHDDMIKKQNTHTDNWIETFTSNKLEGLLEKIIKQTGLECDYSTELAKLFEK
jgi:hypothetical protein